MPIQPYVVHRHDFLGSPQSLKAQRALAYCSQLEFGERIVIPQMSDGPSDTIAQLRQLIDEIDPET